MSDMTKETVFLAHPSKEIKNEYNWYEAWFEEAYKKIGEFTKVKDLKLPDIWVRDYFPLQSADGKKLCLFNYMPEYKKNKEEAIYRECAEAVKRLFPKAEKLGIHMDGGNFIHNKRFGFCLNPYRSPNATDVSENADTLKTALGLEKVIPLPYDVYVPSKDDPFGHIDGVMQFLGDDVLLISEPYDENDKKEKVSHEKWKDTIRKSTDGFIRIESMPNGWGECSHKKDISANGIYINFLETENAVFVPQYNLLKDKDAISVVEDHTAKPVVGIDCEKISQYGGSFHCLTANVMV
jgi:agmatine/peptidylarginine deiminase